MNRKQRRALEKKNRNTCTENFSDKISQFNKLPEQCTTCEEQFDRQDREMLQSWNVVVRQEVVRLFCPECIDKAKQVLEKYGGENERSTSFVHGSQEDT